MAQNVMTHPSERHLATPSSRADATRFLAPVGRLLFTLIFLQSVPMHFTAQGIQHAASQGVPAAGILVPLSGVVALLGGASVLLGFHARIGAVLLMLFLIPVTVMMHQFWNIPDPMMAQIQRIMFMKNVSMFGATLLLAYFGAGPISIDARRQGYPTPPHRL